MTARADVARLFVLRRVAKPRTASECWTVILLDPTGDIDVGAPGGMTLADARDFRTVCIDDEMENPSDLPRAPRRRRRPAASGQLGLLGEP